MVCNCLTQADADVDHLQCAKPLACDLCHMHLLGSQIVMQGVLIWLVTNGSWLGCLQAEMAVITRAFRFAIQDVAGSTHIGNLQSFQRQHIHDSHAHDVSVQNNIEDLFRHENPVSATIFIAFRLIVEASSVGLSTNKTMSRGVVKCMHRFMVVHHDSTAFATEQVSKSLLQFVRDMPSTISTLNVLGERARFLADYSQVKTSLNSGVRFDGGDHCEFVLLVSEG